MRVLGLLAPFVSLASVSERTLKSKGMEAVMVMRASHLKKAGMLWGLTGMLWGCQPAPPAPPKPSSSKTVEAERVGKEAAPSEAQPVLAPQAAVPSQEVAPAPEKPQAAESIERHGLAFAVNMSGDIEPCGCKANPTGGLARRAHVLSLWEKGAQAAPEDEKGAHWYSRIGEHTFDSFTLVDAGDAFSDATQLPEARLARAREVAPLVVERFGAEGMKAQLIGERDLALGLDFLKGLAKKAAYPFIATNLVSKTTQQAPFARYTVVQMGQTKVALLGFLDVHAGAWPSVTQADLMILDPVHVLKGLEAELREQGAEVWMVLSQLAPPAERALVEAFPQIQLVLGGDTIRMQEQPESLLHSWVLSGGHKGRQLAMAVLELGDKRGWKAPWVLPFNEAQHAYKAHNLKAQIARYQQLAEQAPPEGEGHAPNSGMKSQHLQKVAALRAELALLEEDTAGLRRQGPSSLNQLYFQLISLGQEVPHNQAIKDQIDTFVSKHPPL